MGNENGFMVGFKGGQAWNLISAENLSKSAINLRAGVNLILEDRAGIDLELELGTFVATDDTED